MNAAIEHDTTIADFLKRLERVLYEAEVAVAWSPKGSPDLTHALSGLRAEIEDVRKASMLLYAMTDSARSTAQ